MPRSRLDLLTFIVAAHALVLCVAIVQIIRLVWG